MHAHISVVCNSWALSKTFASIPALFMCLSPFLTGFLAYLVLGDSIGSTTDVISLSLNVTGTNRCDAIGLTRVAGWLSGKPGKLAVGVMHFFPSLVSIRQNNAH